ncbi:MAG: N-6 DNA methylase [Blautia sp.]|nr:N-6 DNA methylase [Blautia sp.]MCM1201868.1 N-6 DNA methylase [Bacteroides fragilis]
MAFVKDGTCNCYVVYYKIEPNLWSKGMKNIYCSYYTNSEAITNYMVKRLELQDGDKVLEPSSGEGIFIESILREEKNLEIEALEMNAEAVEILKRKFADEKRVKEIRETDTLFDSQLDMYAMFHGYYDKVIGNPPYGAWQDYDKRKELKHKYRGYYVKETYSLFLLRGLSVLKEGGTLSFIVPDTFLFLNMHENLRKALLKNAKITEVLIFPSRFFPGVSFGYSNLSIITLKRTDGEKKALENTIRVIRGFKDAGELSGVLYDNFAKEIQIDMIRQSDILKNPNTRFLLKDAEIKLDMNKAETMLGDFSDVVTGFYCGDNLKFIRVKDKMVKGSKNYDIVKEDEVIECSSLEGIEEYGKSYVPYVKSAPAKRYLRERDEWFVKWDKEAIAYYNSNKKSRFQNSGFYFRTGIAIPMVKSRTLKATLISNRIFDQSIVGIFPKDEKYLYYILAYMNSDIVCRMIHIINPTANNSSNYIKQLPFSVPDEEELQTVDNLVHKIINAFQEEPVVEETQKELNEIFEKKYRRLLA